MNKQEKLINACKNGNIDEVKKLIKSSFYSAGADVNAIGEDGYSPLLLVLINNNKELSDLLISNGANIDAKDKNGKTPLFLASEKGRKGIAELYISYGADVNAQNNDGETSLQKAIELYISYGPGGKYQRRPDLVEDYLKIIKLLISRGADLNQKDKEGNPIILMFFKQLAGDNEMIKLMISSGADVNSKDKLGNTLLLYEIMKIFVLLQTSNDNVLNEVISRAVGQQCQMLISLGADPSLKNLKGDSYDMIIKSIAELSPDFGTQLHAIFRDLKSNHTSHNEKFN
jgi:ankyrin repeat protein